MGVHLGPRAPVSRRRPPPTGAPGVHGATTMVEFTEQGRLRCMVCGEEAPSGGLAVWSTIHREGVSSKLWRLVQPIARRPIGGAP